MKDFSYNFIYVIFSSLDHINIIKSTIKIEGSKLQLNLNVINEIWRKKLVQLYFYNVVKNSESD
jgi:hypothetical protein